MDKGDLARNPVRLSVVMPAYNEQDAISAAVTDVQHDILNLVPESELIVVDDGSRDDTGAILDRLAETDDRLRIVHQLNSGHGGALITGLTKAQGEYLLLIDSDRQIPTEIFQDFWDIISQGRDGVFGVRRTRNDPQIRLWLTAAIRQALRFVFGVRIFDANIPFKLLRRSIWEEASKFIPSNTLAPSLFLAVYAMLRDYDIAEIDVPHQERQSGVVSIRRLKLLEFSTKALMQLLAFRWRVRNDRVSHA